MRIPTADCMRSQSEHGAKRSNRLSFIMAPAKRAWKFRDKMPPKVGYVPGEGGGM